MVTIRLAVRDGTTSALTPSIVKLLIALFVLTVIGVFTIAALMILRTVRTRRESKRLALPTHNSHLSISSGRKGHRRTLTITSTPYAKPSISMSEKSSFLQNENSRPVPEIRITFPDEEGSKRNSGRVVVVKIGDNGGVGLEPLKEEGLPAYERGDDGFKSLDLERIGGLKENKQWS